MKKAFAIVTDIHGNFTALEAVLEDIRRCRENSSADSFELICLGDSFDGGPEPSRVYDTLKSLGCVHLRGNHEDYLFDCMRHPDNEKYRRPLWKFVPWTVARMGELLLDAEKMCVDAWSDPSVGVCAVHADTKGNHRVPDFYASQSGLSAVFTDVFSFSGRSALYVNGHSHYLGMHRNPHSDEVWINCGSVGYPFVEKPEVSGNAPIATWVLLEADDMHMPNRNARATCRRVPYSSDTLVRKYMDSGALESCAPFSFAIVAQSLFNQDVVYPFFQRVKGLHLTPRETAQLLVQELEKQAVPERINLMLNTLGYASLSMRL
ncbi:MAG: hypothetical protein RJB13_2202 [Pseudomonadota bacterium]|jgi:hypothetical protein